MIKQINIELKPEQLENNDLIKSIAARNCKVKPDQITSIDYIKRSLDSRHRIPKYQIILDVYIDEQMAEKKTVKSEYKVSDEKNKTIIVGSGPAGYFAALELLEAGIKPIVFERGKNVRERRIDLRNIMQDGVVNPESNYCFGEGGAGTFSDGKLYTRSDKRGDIKKVLQILVEHGANPDILIDAHPHIGSNKLHQVVTNIRNTILEFGGEIHFNSKVTDIIVKNGKAIGVVVNGENEHLANNIILATGHSARDIFYLLNDKNIFIESKPFAVGFRIEHKQELIDNIQYGRNHSQLLPPASYKLVAQFKDKGIFSFCMCPGGIIVPSVTDSNELVVNGMSNSGRNSKFANSGIVTTVDEKDFTKFSEFKQLAGLKFQEQLEKKFFTNHESNALAAPAQKMNDFINNKESSSLNESSYIPGLISKNLNKLFPKHIGESLRAGLISFGNKMQGYYSEEANIIGLESRTSSPVRVTRNRETFSHIEIQNLYPCGEGAGYAGGIVSSAIDGQNAAKAIIKKVKEVF
jgi:uncharacterized FAD-dependent dehydrogenase